MILPRPRARAGRRRRSRRPVHRAALVSIAASIGLAVAAWPGSAPPAGAIGAGDRGDVVPPGRVTTLTYCTRGHSRLAMTVFEPYRRRGPTPVVLQVHGGGWERGRRMISFSDSSTLRLLVRSGLAVASIDYRLAPRHPWPDQIEDVLCAIRFLRARARFLGIDPSRVGGWGSSAGGQLVSLAATLRDDDLWDVGPYAGRSTELQAVADEFGPTDLAVGPWGRYVDRVVPQVFGAPAGRPSAVLRAASPLDQVARGDPPFLIVQGTADRIVPAQQSLALARRLREDHVPVHLLLVRGGPHGLDARDESPTSGVIDHDVASFLVRTLTRRTPVDPDTGHRESSHHNPVR